MSMARICTSCLCIYRRTDELDGWLERTRHHRRRLRCSRSDMSKKMIRPGPGIGLHFGTDSTSIH
ncbi:hypothetical protein BpHYR1_010995 [Brachionus plicatilis]|uniref:Uncharacterized protein n=1 Tax=Brachionus plicatilis TaxID=10195 RepID=A0A3M7PDE9_BRAPC|nr:hypothetical protein BpHYR1_010995 [Brachionus plicatilis]